MSILTVIKAVRWCARYPSPNSGNTSRGCTACLTRLPGAGSIRTRYCPARELACRIGPRSWDCSGQQRLSAKPPELANRHANKGSAIGHNRALPCRFLAASLPGWTGKTQGKILPVFKKVEPERRRFALRSVIYLAVIASAGKKWHQQLARRVVAKRYCEDSTRRKSPRIS